MKNIALSILAVLTLSSLSSFALAKGGTPQNHHCMKDGTELAGKTRKECKKDGGKWDKMPGDAAKSSGEPTPKAAE